MYTTDRAKAARTLRFLSSGIVSVGLYYAVFYLLTERAGVWYLASSLIAFVLYWLANFGLHKYWTFGNREKESAGSQAAKHLGMTMGFLAVSTAGLYVLVEYVGLWYMAASAMLTIILSIASYVLMRKIFRAA